MTEANPDDTLLLIRCPSCGQRFKVGDDLRGRTVECGACEHRFRINDEVIVRGKKFYPGERRDARLNRFQRVPLAIAPAATSTSNMRYTEPPDPAVFEPVSPQRIVAGLVGVAGMVLMALLLMFGANRGGILDGMTTGNRLLMAGFTGFLGTVLLAYANPRARLKALSVGILLSAGLLALPFTFTVGSMPLASRAVERLTPQETPAVSINPGPESTVSTQSTEISALRALIGTDPLVTEIERLAAEGSTRKAVGLWLRNLRQQNRPVVKEFILRATGADPLSHYYPRDGGDFLFVLTGINQSLDEVAKIASALGSIEKIHQEISVVEIRVNNENFIEGPIEKLTDRNSPAFYDLNKRELESIDIDRVERAVKRLAEAEPKIYRNDIARKLISLLGTPGVKFKGAICDALGVWSDQPGLAGEAALKEARELFANNVAIPNEMITLLVKEKNSGVLPILEGLWERNPNHWESQYGDMGPAVEASLLRRFPESTGPHRYSAVRLLGRVGGADSLPVLRAAISGADPELRVLIGNASQSILGRLSP
ncbi:MAG: hypothetical protein Q8Q59_13875 [Luteolibacter sp.]|jgi:predicted Zn finger-like uncharacterized protein|nr:hypothetical protein [Luteolibacter sp.]